MLFARRYTLMMMAMATAGFGRRYGDAEKTEEQSLHVFRIEVSVEHAEIYLDRVEDKLDGYEHREQVLAGDEPVDSYEEHD